MYHYAQVVSKEQVGVFLETLSFWNSLLSQSRWSCLNSREIWLSKSILNRNVSRRIHELYAGSQNYTTTVKEYIQDTNTLLSKTF